MLLAHRALMRDVGRYGESISEAMSERAHPNYSEPDAIRFIAHHQVNQAEAAVDVYRETQKDQIPEHGVTFWVERKDYSERS